MHKLENFVGRGAKNTNPLGPKDPKSHIFAENSDFKYEFYCTILYFYKEYLLILIFHIYI